MFTWKAEGLCGILDGEILLSGRDLFQIVLPDGRQETGRLESLEEKENRYHFLLSFPCGLSIAGVFTTLQSEYDEGRFEFEVSNASASEVFFHLQFSLQAAGEKTPRWMIPALFYKDNRPPENIKLYPRYDPLVHHPEQWISPAWSFRSDRSSHPGVFVFTEKVSACVSVDADTELGLSGVFFSGHAGQPPCLGVCFPYREEPRTYSNCHDPEQKPVVSFARLASGETARLKLTLAFSMPDLHFYHPVLKKRYYEERDAHPLSPWVSPEKAVRLCAEGLYRWHYDPRERVLYETCPFDRYFARKDILGMSQVDRPHMHVGWISGAAVAYGLLQAGYSLECGEYRSAGKSVIDRIAEEGISPSGFFWSQWTVENGWDTGWNPQKNWLQGRTAAEAVLFILKAMAIESQAGQGHPSWEQAVRSNLDQVVRIQREDGNLGSYYDYRSGQVEVWEGAGSLLWIAALVDAADRFDEELYLQCARRAGDYYARYVEDEYIYGAPEDVHLSPTSEDGYDALIAYWALYRRTGEPSFLHLARRAADWLLSFRWCYNLQFSPLTILGKYDFRSRGGDLASPCNQHLHSYGLICHPELMELARETGDAFYSDRARDALECFLQFIAREDGDFGARKGMTPEQFYQTDWWQPKGHLLALAHAWTSGFLLYACQHDRRA